MCLNFCLFVESSFKKLNWSWSILICNTSGKEFSLETANNLVVVSCLFISTSLFCFQWSYISNFLADSLKFPNRFVSAWSINNRFEVFPLWSVNWDAVERIVFKTVVPNLLGILLITCLATLVIILLFWVQFPQENIRVPAATNKASIILKPTDGSYWAIMSLECKVILSLTSVELENANTWTVCAGKVLTAMWKLNFIAKFDLDRLEFNQLFVKYVHHSYALSKTNYNMKATRMQS